jgi:hypothetical protein
MRTTRELDPDAGFVVIVTTALLATGLIMFAPEILQSDWRSLLLKQELPQSFRGSSNFEKAMAFTGPKEGGCQDWDRDKGNWYKGRKGWTCFGIVPATADQAVADGVMRLPPGVDVWSLNKWFDADESEFKAGATKIYQHYYFKPIKGDELPEIVAVIAFDISVNGGSGLANGFLRDTTHIKEPKARAKEINRLMEAHYRGIVARRPDQEVFLGGWLNRVKKQRKLIAKY